jgi:pilus assembly protein CpaB
MDVRRIAIALLIALGISAAATYLVYSNLREKQRSAKPQSMKVVAAASTLQAGAALASENLTLMDWPTNIPLAGSFSKPEDVVGRALIYPIPAKSPILEHDLAVPGSGIGLTVKIPEGMRAVAVRSNDVIGVAGFLYPGSHVDVLLTYRPQTTGPAPTPVTQTVLQNVEVLTAGQRIEPDPKGKPENVAVVTLLLSPQDAEKIILAGTQGGIQFILRNGADRATVETAPVDMADVTMGAKKKKIAEPRIMVAKAKPVPKLPKFYVVETVAGDKRSTDKFE